MRQPSTTRTSWTPRMMGVLFAVMAAFGVLVFAVVVTEEVSAILANKDITLHPLMNGELPAGAIAARGGAVVEQGAATEAWLTVSNVTGFSTGGLLWARSSLVQPTSASSSRSSSLV
ncbi:hypothetical protein ELQ92_12265 [Labedella populi]|uniref:Uncharacterized protein n=1 Tax=Labedella populi TaxID=2498850 RepID=A0A444Q6R7_9MICO|nr:hypothetical protein [Labedella populi]RWZ59597.1 hypothetical protein ELQ92_12265 [Labedella populi]